MKELVEVIDQLDADITFILSKPNRTSEDEQKLGELDRERTNRINALLEIIRNGSVRTSVS